MKLFALLLIPVIIFLCASAVMYPIDRLDAKYGDGFWPWWLAPLIFALIFPAGAACLLSIFAIVSWVVS